MINTRLSLKGVIKSLLPEEALRLVRSNSYYIETRANFIETRAEMMEVLRICFPDVPITNAKLINHGFDNAVIIMDNRTIYRFPRSPQDRAKLASEIRLLGELRQNTRVSVPNYYRVDLLFRVAAYELIVGDKLTPALFRSLQRSLQESVLIQLAEILGHCIACHWTLLLRTMARYPHIVVGISTKAKNFFGNDGRC